MAKKRRKKTSNASARTTIVRSPAPIIRVSAPRTTIARRTRRARRHLGVGGGGSGRVRALINPALAGGGVGLLIKSGMVDKLPEIPVVGRIGSAAIVLAYVGGGSGMIHEMAKGCAFLAGYQMMAEGKIHGDEDEYVQSNEG